MSSDTFSLLTVWCIIFGCRLCRITGSLKRIKSHTNLNFRNPIDCRWCLRSCCPPLGDGRCPICDSYVRPATLVRICDECNYGSYEGRCVVCGATGISDAYYCTECTLQEKDRDGCPKIINLGSAKTDLFYERKKYAFKKRWQVTMTGRDDGSRWGSLLLVMVTRIDNRFRWQSTVIGHDDRSGWQTTMTGQTHLKAGWLTGLESS